MCLLTTGMSSEPSAIVRIHIETSDSFQLSWILNCSTRLWSSLFSAQEHLSFDQFSEQIFVMFLEILRNLFFQLANVTYETANLSKASILFSQIIAALVLLEPARLIGDLEKSITCGLLELAGPLQTLSIVLEAFDEYLLPILVEIMESPSRFGAFGIDLQVCSHGSLK